MARGFESKSVADQQQAAFESKRGKEGPEDPALVSKRRKLELARTSVVQQLEVAQAAGHKEMLRRALEALERDLRSLTRDQ
jgi:hypothetical protein